MEGIEHRTVEVNGIKMHIAEKGKEGPVVLFLHGFPELWYSWRHQIVALGSLGYRAVAPDLRGYGDTEAPSSISSYTGFHIVGDLVALIDLLGVDQVFLVAHDWGAIIGWYLCMFRPEVGTAYVMKNILTTRQTGPPIFPKGEYGTGFNPDTPDTLPSWLTEEDLAYFVSKFEKTGFTGALNCYRNFNVNWELMAPWNGVKIKVPVKFITGDLDMVYTSLNMKEYIHGGGFKEDVPNLEEVIIQKGVAHFNNQEAAEEISNHIYEFIKKF
uniref:AB hydrolase-1 domain-containing protein n=1 Tax=Medicago truncatula TaxID=3880 RepID=I3SM55_MEDTR|nr:unknown [Medicago truncatula]